jgi:thiol-disulfide isomerase/thioredoxin
MSRLRFHQLTLIFVIGVSIFFITCRSKKAEIKRVQGLPPVEQITIPQLQELIKSNQGKITVVNFWASWCQPCKDEMPSLVKLQNKYEDELHVLLLAIDEVSLVDSIIRPLLQKSGVDFISYIKEEGNDEEAINAMNPEWSGPLPTTFIYDEEGNQVEMLIGEQPFERFEAAVKKHLTD